MVRNMILLAIDYHLLEASYYAPMMYLEFNILSITVSSVGTEAAGITCIVWKYEFPDSNLYDHLKYFVSYKFYM